MDIVVGKSGSVESVAGCETDPGKMIAVDGDEEKLDRIMKETLPIQPLRNVQFHHLPFRWKAKCSHVQGPEDNSWSGAIGRKLSSYMPTFSPRLMRRAQSECVDARPQPPLPPPPTRPPPPPPPKPATLDPSTAIPMRKRDSLVSGLAKWSPALGRKVAGYIGQPTSFDDDEENEDEAGCEGAKEPSELEVETWAGLLVSEALAAVFADLAEESEKAVLAAAVQSKEERRLLGQPVAKAEPVEAVKAEVEEEEGVEVEAEGEELADEDKSFYRYYHVFREEELGGLVESVPSLRLKDVYYDHANWAVIAQRL